MSENRRVRITLKPGDRFPTIVDAATGAAIPCTDVDFHFDMKGRPTLTITTPSVEVDIEADARVKVVCPRCKEEQG